MTESDPGLVRSVLSSDDEMLPCKFECCIKAIDVGNGKSVATFVKDGSNAEHIQEIVKPTLQIAKFHVVHFCLQIKQP